MKALLEKEEGVMVEKMQKNKNDIEEKLNTGKEHEEILKSVTESDRPDAFLQVCPDSVSTNQYKIQFSLLLLLSHLLKLVYGTNSFHLCLVQWWTEQGMGFVEEMGETDSWSNRNKKASQSPE